MLNIDLNSPEYLEIFKEEVGEIMEKLEAELIDYESKQSIELNKTIKRDFHTLKGDFATYGMQEYTDFFHTVESQWLRIESLEIEEIRSIISSVLEKITVVRKKIFKNEDINMEKDDTKIEEQKTISEKRRYEILIDFKGETVEEFDLGEFKNILEANGNIISYEYLNDNIPSFSDLLPEQLYIKIRIIIETINKEILLSLLDEVIERRFVEIKDEEEVIEKEKAEKVMEEDIKETKEKLEIKSEIKENKTESKKEVTSIRVSTKKLDTLVNIVGELIVAHSSLKIFRDYIREDKSEEFDKFITDLNTITDSMQEDVLSVRMIPIGNTFVQFKRMIRDLSRQMDKKIKIEIRGGETEIDKTIIEKIVDPLRHMIRNSIDHGIESPEERIAKGKNEEGLVKISSYNQSGEVIIEIWDDGKGINKEQVVEKAIKNGIIKKGDSLSENEIFSLLFEAGFSTKEQVTSISGRGVGMDVVKTNIEELRGKIDIESKYGEYTLFRISLPLTLAIIDGMLVKVGDNVYVLPILSILESLQPLKENIKSIQGRGEILEIRGEYYPLIKLFKMFNIEGAIEDPLKSTVFLVETPKGNLGIMVDEVVDHQQIVIKKLGVKSNKQSNFSGATILGTGEVALILDIKNIFDSIVKKTRIGG